MHHVGLITAIQNTMQIIYTLPFCQFTTTISEEKSKCEIGSRPEWYMDVAVALQAIVVIFSFKDYALEFLSVGVLQYVDMDFVTADQWKRFLATHYNRRIPPAKEALLKRLHLDSMCGEPSFLVAIAHPEWKRNECLEGITFSDADNANALDPTPDARATETDRIFERETAQGSVTAGGWWGEANVKLTAYRSIRNCVNGNLKSLSLSEANSTREEML